jgi:DNA-binding phage protein
VIFFGESIKVKLKNLNETLMREFQDPDFAALYLKEALKENGMEGFLLALRNVIQATVMYL